VSSPQISACDSAVCPLLIAVVPTLALAQEL